MDGAARNFTLSGLCSLASTETVVSLSEEALPPVEELDESDEPPAETLCDAESPLCEYAAPPFPPNAVEFELPPLDDEVTSPVFTVEFSEDFADESLLLCARDADKASAADSLLAEDVLSADSGVVEVGLLVANAGAAANRITLRTRENFNFTYSFSLLVA